MPRSHQDEESTVIDLAAVRGRIDRRLAVSREAQAQLLELYAKGVETRSLAERFGVQENYIRKLASRNRVRKGQCAENVSGSAEEARDVPVRNGHLRAYKRARRGFEVPQPLESAYTQLLIRGLSRRAAAAELGLLPPESAIEELRCNG